MHTLSSSLPDPYTHAHAQCVMPITQSISFVPHHAPVSRRDSRQPPTLQVSGVCALDGEMRAGTAHMPARARSRHAQSVPRGVLARRPAHTRKHMRWIRGYGSAASGGRWSVALNNQRESRDVILGASRGLPGRGARSPPPLPCADAPHLSSLYLSSFSSYT